MAILWVGTISIGSSQNASGTYKKEIKKHRKEYKQGFLNGGQSPLDKKGVRKLDYFRADETYRVQAEIELTRGEKPFDMPTYSGITKSFIKYAVAHFQLNGKKYELTIYKNLTLIRLPQYRDKLFLPFKDLSNGEETYGGGRYLDFRISDISNNQLIIDFNKAYNPFCAYSDGYICPVPPIENHLAVKIYAGERNFEALK